MASVWDELRRRNVVRVAIAYAVVSWLILQLADVLIPLLTLPEWVGRLVFLVLVIGFPLALIFAWVFELTPEGIQRDSKVSHNQSVSQHTGRRLNFLIVGALVIALGYSVITRDPVNPDEPPIDAAVLNRPMVAVLPFVKTSGDSTFDHLSLGLMDEIIVSLQRFKAFPVVSRGAVLMFQSRDKSILETAEELNAQYVIDGSIRADGDNLRVLVTMSDSKGDQVWARPFVLASDLEGLFTVVEEVAASIAGAVRESEVDRVVVSNRPPVAAWEHYIKGLSIVLDWSPDRHEEGRGHIESALELDPNMAEAWWAMGEFEVVEMMFFPAGEEESRIRLEKGVGYFQRANEISPFQGGACGCLGVMLAMLNRASEAFTLLEGALHANPLSTRLRVDYAQVLVSEGRFDEARAMAESATGMEPIGWDLALSWTIRAIADLAEGRDDQARANVHRAKYASARNVYSTPSAILILYALGDREDAIELYQDFVSENPEFSFDNPLTVYYVKSIDSMVVSRHRANAEFPPNALAIVDELARQTATSEN